MTHRVADVYVESDNQIAAAPSDEEQDEPAGRTPEQILTGK